MVLGPAEARRPSSDPSGSCLSEIECFQKPHEKMSDIPKDLALREAQIRDMDILLEWRNDPRTRYASHNTAPIIAAEHARWFRESLRNPERKMYIAEEAGRPVGTVRVDHCEGAFELSWTVSRQASGRGIGKWMVQMVAEQINGPIKAQVKVDNHASRKIAESVGMTIASEGGGIIHYLRGACGDREPGFENG